MVNRKDHLNTRNYLGNTLSALILLGDESRPEGSVRMPTRNLCRVTYFIRPSQSLYRGAQLLYGGPKPMMCCRCMPVQVRVKGAMVPCWAADLGFHNLPLRPS